MRFINVMNPITVDFKKLVVVVKGVQLFIKPLWARR